MAVVDPVRAARALWNVLRNLWRWVMVLQHAHPFSDVSFPKLDFARIAAGAGAIALNVAVLLLLLVPAGLPDVAAPVDRGMMVVPIIERVVPPTPPVVPVTTPTPPTVPVYRVPVRTEVAPPVVDQVVVEDGVLPADETITTPVDTGPADIAPPALPVAGMRLEYAKAPPPPYPRDALRAGLQGTVLLQVLVDVDGRPLRVEIQKSSGHHELDDAARKFVLRHWTFRPATVDGRPVQAVGIVPIAYDLG
jgi:protein TonB